MWSSHGPLQQRKQRVERVRIEHVCLPQPRPAGLCDTKRQVQQIGRAVRVRRNAHEHALRLCQAASNVG